ncbi:50S ribosomal protein L3 [Feifania hominis]|uniref:Large ribosomal subunit protein uL3 n=1 Tax=Feifania hominis TaxID=2763660 RepID=A0A926HR66_9FIRM|nr:50S ribosomal protein L3 [Feifania hominis]MBC8537092.1 50S ribosomal protein L3 [Feifania hominis]
MEKGIIAKKLGMTQIFDADRKLIPVTVLEAGPCVVVQKKTVEADGYDAVQLGYEDIPERKVNKPMKGHFDKGGAPYKKVLGEFQLDNTAELNVGDVITVEKFAEGDRIDVTGISKGKGYAGTIKRYGHGRTPTSHGGGPVHRHAGSNGSATDPSRVMPGKKLPGHMGAEQVTIQNLDVVKVDAENNLLVVKGAIPGPKGGVIMVKTSVKA